MKFLNQNSYAKKQNIILYASIIIHIVFFVLNLFIGGYNFDETMTILNAKSLVRCGTDIMGEKLPVYFDTWLYSGQSPMSTYAVALSIKIFGENYFAYRFPILIIGIIGLFALKVFLNEVFIKGNKNKEKNYMYTYVILILASFSPWHIFSCTYMLDCNFLPHFMMIAMMFLAKAVNAKTNKLYYAASMVFFGLGFYCYIASVLIIPVFLAVFFLTLIIKKKIPLSCIITSALTIFVVSLPFILFGLVTVGAVKPFSFLGFSFSEMPYYSRAQSITVGNGLGILGSLKNIISNLSGALFLLLMPDFLMINPQAMFTYTNLIGGIIMFFGALIILLKLIKKTFFISFQTKLFAICSIISILCFCSLSDSGEVNVAYRFGTMFYLLILIEGIGFIELGNILKKINFKKFFTGFMVISFILFSFEFVALYAKNIYTKNYYPYGDSFYDCISFIEDECNTNRFTVYIKFKQNCGHRNQTQTVYLQDYYYNDKTFNNLENILKSVGVSAEQNNWSYPVPQITTDNRIKYQEILADNIIKDDYNIIYNFWVEDVNYNSNEYSVKNFGLWSVIYRTE